MAAPNGEVHWTTRVNQVIVEVVNHDLSRAYFNTPPPGTSSGPGTGPICFGLILQRLMDKAYGSPLDVYADIQQIWAQCKAMNPPGSAPYQAAEKLAPVVDLLWRHMGLGTSRQQAASQAAAQQQYQQQQPQALLGLLGGGRHAGMGGLGGGAGLQSAAALAQEQAALARLEQADQQLAVMQQQQQQLLMAQQQSRVATIARQQSFGMGGSGGGANGSIGGGGGGGAAAGAPPGGPLPLGGGPYAGNSSLGPLATPNLSLGQGSLGPPGGSGMSFDPLLGGGGGMGGGSGIGIGGLGDMDSLLQMQQAQAQQLDRMAAQERARREQRRLALMRLRQELMAQAMDPNAPPHPLLDGAVAAQLGLVQGLGGRGGGGASGIFGDLQGLPQATPGAPLHREPSLAEQQQQMLEAMASGQPAPAQAHGEQPVGAAPPPRSLSAMLSGGGDLQSLQQQQAAAAGLGLGQAQGPAAAVQEHERQRQKLALLKQNMLMALQQRQAMLQQQQQGAGAPQQQQHLHVQQQVQQLQMQLGQGGGGGQGLQQQQQPPQQPQLQRQDTGGTLLSPGTSQQLASPTASFGGDRRRPSRQRPALAAQMGAAVKEAARPQAGAPGDSQLRQGHPLNRCLLVIERLLQHDDAEPFAEPVDAEGLGLADYRQVIRRPMDLGTIRSRLAPGLQEGWGMISYKSTDEVLSDVQLVWANCRRYNAAGSTITEMCSRLETAFCQLWEEAGLGSAAAAAARPHVLSSPTPHGGRQHDQRGKQHQRSAHGKHPPKQSPRNAQKQSLANLHSQGRAAGAQGSKQGGRKHAGGGSGSKRQRGGSGGGGGEAHAQAPSPASASGAPPASLVGSVAAGGLPGDAPASVQQLQEAEVAEEALQLQRLLSTGGSSPVAEAAAALAVDAAGRASPMLWEAGPAGAAAGQAGSLPPGAVAGLDSRAAHVAGGAAAAAAADPFGSQWHAAGAAAGSLQSPIVGGRAASDVLLHPNRGAPSPHSSLLHPMMPQQPAGGAGAALAAQQHPPPLPPQHPQQQQQQQHLRLPPVLSGLAAATAIVTPEELQREQQVLAAWQQVQQQRQAALRAMAAAELASEEALKARRELAAVQAAEAAGAGATSSQQQPQQTPHDVQQQQQQQQVCQAQGPGQPGSGPSLQPSQEEGGSELTTDGAGRGTGGAAAAAAAQGVSLQEAAAAARSSSELAAVAAAARQARFDELMRLGAQLFGRACSAPTSSTGNGEGGSSGSTLALPGHSAGGSAGQACAVATAAAVAAAAASDAVVHVGGGGSCQASPSNPRGPAAAEGVKGPAAQAVAAPAHAPISLDPAAA